MSKRKIRWEKFRNPLLPVGETEENGRVALRATPFGVEGLQFNQEFRPEHTYILHTNFDIDESVKITIENIEGVEILEIYSPYRARITIGKAFSAKSIRRLINDRLCSEAKKYNFDDDTNMKIYTERIKMKNQEHPWSMFILPNGNFESRIFVDQYQMEDTITKWEDIRQIIGGVIIAE